MQPVAAAKPGNLWADVNDVVTAFAACRSDPRFPGPNLLVMLAAHRIDGPAALELSDADMCGALGVRTAEQLAFMHEVIDGMRVRALEELGLTEEELLGCPREGTSPSVRSPSVATGPDASTTRAADDDAAEDSSRRGASCDKDDGDEDDNPEEEEEEEDPDMPRKEDFTFIECALAKHRSADGSDDPLQRLHASRVERRRAEENARRRPKTFNARRMPPRELLSPALGTTTL